jgi:hypothetical protein
MALIPDPDRIDASRRRRLAVYAGLAALLLLVASRCNESPAQTVDQLASDPPRLEKELRKCENDPGGHGKKPICENARAARLEYTVRRLRGSRPTAPLPDPDTVPVWTGPRQRRL